MPTTLPELKTTAFPSNGQVWLPSRSTYSIIWRTILVGVKMLTILSYYRNLSSRLLCLSEWDEKASSSLGFALVQWAFQSTAEVERSWIFSNNTVREISFAVIWQCQVHYYTTIDVSILLHSEVCVRRRIVFKNDHHVAPTIFSQTLWRASVSALLTVNL